MVRRGVENSRCRSEGLALSDIRCGRAWKGRAGGGEAEGVISGGLAGDMVEGGSIAFARTLASSNRLTVLTPIRATRWHT